MVDVFDVPRTPFDLDTFQQILEAMDGYSVLPRHKLDGVSQVPIEPWNLPGMPDVGSSSWKYHVGFAIDRGFVDYWTPRKTEQHIDVIGNTSYTLTDYDRDPNVSSCLQPARLTYAGKEFIDNLKNQTVKEKALQALSEWGLPVAMQVVTEAAKNLLPIG